MPEPTLDLKSRFLGCLVGCAVGDALGAPFEGYWEHQLPRRKALLRGFAEVEGYPRGQYTDDTQLTLATIESIIRQGELVPADIARSIAALWKNHTVVGPGGSCTFAANAFLKTRDWTTCGAPVGQAGNGTAMRTAALGLYFLRDPERLPATVADVARITHKDPRSLAGGVVIAKAAQLLATLDIVDAGSFCGSIADAILPYEPRFADLIQDLPSRLKEDEETARHPSHGPALRSRNSPGRSSPRSSSPLSWRPCGWCSSINHPGPTPSRKRSTWEAMSIPSARSSGRWRESDWGPRRSRRISPKESWTPTGSNRLPSSTTNTWSDERPRPYH